MVAASFQKNDIMLKLLLDYLLKFLVCLQLPFIVVVLGFSERALAEVESKPPSVQALKMSEQQAEEMQTDDFLTEQAWQLASRAKGLLQREPFEGEPATEVTEFRVIYDERTLYIGVLAHDKNPEKIISQILQRDKIMETDFGGKPIFAGDDAVAILPDPFHDHRNAVVFATNPNGAEFDALISDEGREFNIDWRAVWQVAAQQVNLTRFDLFFPEKRDFFLENAGIFDFGFVAFLSLLPFCFSFHVALASLTVEKFR